MSLSPRLVDYLRLRAEAVFRETFREDPAFRAISARYGAINGAAWQAQDILAWQFWEKHRPFREVES